MKGIKILVKDVCKEQEGTRRKDARKIRWVQAKKYSGKLARKYARVCKNINKELGKSILEKQQGTKQNVCKMSSREPGKKVCKVAKKQVIKLEESSQESVKNVRRIGSMELRKMCANKGVKNQARKNGRKVCSNKLIMSARKARDFTRKYA